MDILTYHTQLARGGYGLWYGADTSQALVENPRTLDTGLDPVPSHHFIKFGGDWGGLWGSPDTWRALRAANPDTVIIPWLYCLPEHSSQYAGLIGPLLQLGYPMVGLDVEFEWENQEAALRSMLDSLRTGENPTAMTGIAWFGGYPTWEAFRDVVNGYDSLLYMPQAYLSELTKLPEGQTPVTYSQDWLDKVVPDCPISMILDSATLADQASVQWAQMEGRGPLSVWYNGTLTQDLWSKLDHAPAQEDQLSFPRSAIEEANTNLGQSLNWLESLRGKNKAHNDLVTAIESSLHRVRQITLGE